MPGKEIPMKVDQLMSHPVRTCSASDMLDRAARLMWEHDVGCIVVESNGRIDGIITDRDICMAGRFAGKPLWGIRVGEVMSRPVETVHRKDSVETAERLMRIMRVRRLPVVNDSNNLVGLVSLDDLAREAGAQRSGRKVEVSAEQVAGTLAEICEPLASMRDPEFR
jgi:CBS domain-containing protein